MHDSGEGVSEKRLAALEVAARFQNVRRNEVAFSLKTNNGHAGQLLWELTRDGYLTSSSWPGLGSLVYNLTDKGRAALKATHQTPEEPEAER